MEPASVTMFRDDLDTFPRYALPSPFSIRWYRDGDAVHWIDIHRQADLYNSIPPDLFDRIFGNNGPELKCRQCYLLDREQVVGTGTAWFGDSVRGASWGRIHWLAIIPSFQHRGLAKSMMTALCQRLSDLGHKRAYLKTLNLRLNAIRLYLHFGFVPDIQSTNDEQMWASIRGQLE